MTPEGPYRNEVGWATGDWYVLRTQHAIVIVRGNQQPHEGTEHTSIRDARAWMKDNGFVLKPNREDR